MRVGVFYPTLNVYGGGEFVAVAIANALAQNHHKVALFTNAPVDPAAIKNYFGETLNPNIENIVQATYFTPRALADFYQTIIHSYAAKYRCDLFIDAFSNCVFPWANISYIHFPYLNKYSYKTAFPYLRRPRIMQAGTLPHVIIEKKLIDYDKRLVLANSYYTANEVKQYSGKTAQVLYPPFSSVISAIGKTATKTADDNLVVTVSRLESNKLLERIPVIAAQTGSNIQFAIVGRTGNKQTLINLERLVKKYGLEDRVRIYPDASAETKFDLLKRAKIYLHTMIGEHFGISIVEAMALGCIPIVHDSGGMREFVPTDYRYVTLQQAAELITAKIAGWSADNTECMKEIAEQFSIQNFSKQFMAYFNAYSRRI